MPSPGERIREHYRRQGAERTVDRIIHDIIADANISMNLSTYALENIIRVVEGALQPAKAVPNE